MTTTTISATRASLRKLAAKNGWVLDTDSSDFDVDIDVFNRGDRQIKASFRSWGPTKGAFYAGFLIALNPPAEIADQLFEGIIDDGGVAKVRTWMKDEA